MKLKKLINTYLWVVLSVLTGLIGINSARWCLSQADDALVTLGAVIIVMLPIVETLILYKIILLSKKETSNEK